MNGLRRDGASRLAIAIAAGFVAWPSSGYAALPSGVRVAAPGDMVELLGQWLVDRNGTHWTPPSAFAPSAVASVARRYDALGNRTDFELAAPPPAVVAAALDLPAPQAAAAAAPVPAPKTAEGVFERLAAGGRRPSILIAQADGTRSDVPGPEGESAASIEARVERRVRETQPAVARPDAPDASPAEKMPMRVQAVFDAESAEIDPDLAGELDAFAAWLAAAPARRATATGWASAREEDGTAGFARARRLAESRAIALRQDLVERGAPAASLALDARVASGPDVHRATAEILVAAPPAVGPAVPAAAQPPAAAAPQAGAAARGPKASSPPRRLVPPAPGA